MTQQFNLERKDRLFYDRFEYAVSFRLEEANCLRELSHENIEHAIKRRRHWQAMANQRWVTTARALRTISEQTRADLHAFADLLLTAQHEYKLVVTTDYATVYTNSLALIAQIDQLPYITRQYCRQVIIDRPKDTIRLKDPKHQYRSYFKLVRLSQDQKDQLRNFLFHQHDHVRLSPALHEWLAHSYTATQDYFFVDYNSVNWITMLALVQPGLIRKTMQIIPAK